MIASLRGQVAAIGLEHAIIDVGGVGLAVRTVPSMLATLRVGEQADLATTLVVREDSLTLFGFTSTAAKELFELVQSVSGVGPKIALALLAVFEPDELRTALSTGDAKALTRTPGIGKKSADRLILELKDKVGRATASAGAAASPIAGQDRLIDALTGLGFSSSQAQQALSSVLAHEPHDAVSESNMGELLRKALATLGNTR